MSFSCNHFQSFGVFIMNFYPYPCCLLVLIQQCLFPRNLLLLLTHQPCTAPSSLLPKIFLIFQLCNLPRGNYICGLFPSLLKYKLTKCTQSILFSQLNIVPAKLYCADYELWKTMSKIQCPTIAKRFKQTIHMPCRRRIAYYKPIILKV